MTSQLIEKITAHAQSDSLEDARERCADGTYFPNNLRILIIIIFIILQVHSKCFGCQPHPSSGVHKTVTRTSGTVQLRAQKI